MQEPEPGAVPRWKELTGEQIDDMVAAFNELQVTGHFTAIIGQSGNIAVEIREQVIDPETLAFILDIADRYQLRPYIFRTQHNAPIVLQPIREPATAAPDPGYSDVVPIREPEQQPADTDTPDDPQFKLIELPNAVLVSLPVEGLEEDDWPMAQFGFETTSERDLAREVAEQAGQLAAACAATGIAPAHALAEAHEAGMRAFARGKGTLAVEEPQEDTPDA